MFHYCVVGLKALKLSEELISQEIVYQVSYDDAMIKFTSDDTRFLDYVRKYYK